jgi:hypothetical protein
VKLVELTSQRASSWTDIRGTVCYPWDRISGREYQEYLRDERWKESYEGDEKLLQRILEPGSLVGQEVNMLDWLRGFKVC